MGSNAVEIRSLIERMSGNDPNRRAISGNIEILDGTVSAVDMDTLTVSVDIEEEVTLPGVCLRAVGDEASGLVLVPAEGSEVIFGKVRGEPDFFLIKTSKLDRIIMCVGTVRMEINANGYALAKENESLKKLMSDLLAAILNMKFTTNVGPTLALINTPDFQAIKTRFDDFLINT